jgi:hypothetical protein
MTKQAILTDFEMFSIGTEGIGGWIRPETDDRIFDRISDLESKPLSKVQLNQLLGLGHEAPVSDDFFRYYWLDQATSHPYPVTKLPDYLPEFHHSDTIRSIRQLRWGLYRIFVDGLLYFGNVRTGYRVLRSLSLSELNDFFAIRRFDTEKIRQRGPALPLQTIARDDRYLISEMACKSYGDIGTVQSDLRSALTEAFTSHLASGGGPVSVRQLLEGERIRSGYAARQQEFIFSADDVLDEMVTSQQELEAKFSRVAGRFVTARRAALSNTDYYLSMVHDLDVYVATSMRTRKDFRDMAADCDRIFSHEQIQDLNLRYFDPTLSAAVGHEDKGLIECLMVKCAKALVYCAGERESYGKDAEAAMALSLGKPVIFYCTNEAKTRFYREVHPLSRLIEFQTGVAVGAVVTDDIEKVCELLRRVFNNQMEYTLQRNGKGNLRLHEELTDSVVRLQTSNRLLSETFWNHYHNRSPGAL